MGTGIVIFLAALGMMLGLAAQDVSKLNSWQEVTVPSFVASQMVHFAAVVTAFIGGKLIPTDPMKNGNRKSDPQ